MSDTPRTDAVKIACGFQAVPEPMLQHAYELERENAALRELLQRSLHWLDAGSAKFADDIKKALRKKAQP